jgi:hypothetical protein
VSDHQSYNAHAPRPAGNEDWRGINGGVGNRASVNPGTLDGINVGYLNGEPRQGGVNPFPGSAFVPGSSGHERTERVRIRPGLLDLIFENWLPFTAWLTSRFIGPRAPAQPWQSPVDLWPAGEVITRAGPFPSGSRPFPYPYMIGSVSGFMPMLDQYSMAWAYGKTPSGPGVLTPVPIPWDAQYPNLPKVSG